MRTLLSIAIVLFVNSLFGIEEEKIQPNALVNGDGFGGATCLKGDVMIVGAPYADIAGVDSVGVVQYFKRIAGSWVFQMELPSPDGVASDYFGFSVDFNGTHLVVGAPFNDENGLNSGAAYIYEFDGSSFSLVQKNMASSGAPGDEYGRSVAIGDTTIIVGAAKDDDVAPDAGAAYLYNLDNNNWTEAQKLTSSFVEFGNEFFGYSVAIHKDRCLIGATLDDDAATDAGTAFIYFFDGSTWTFEQKLSPSDGGSSHSFGFSTSINDSLLIVGAFGANNTVSSSGAAYIFRRSGTTWVEEEILFQADINVDDWFGYDVEIEGNTVIVTALNNDEFVLNGGSVYLIRYDEVLSEWVPEFIEFAQDGLLNWRYGFSCSLDGLNFVVGAIEATGTTVKSGAVYYYEICTHKLNQTLCSVSADSLNTANYVLWNSFKTTLIDSFLIYKTISGANNYSRIGAVDYYDINEWYDDADINFTAYSYKISSANICGTESDSSSKHTSILLSTMNLAGDVVLNWSVAEGYSFDYYRIYRDPQGDGTFDLMFAVTNTQFTYTDFSPTGNNITEYRIQAFNLNPCTGLSQPFSSTLSNSSSPALLDIEENLLGDLRVYPNPAKNNLFVMGNLTSNSSFKIFNSIGSEVINGQLNSNMIDLSLLQSGIYFLHIVSQGEMKVLKFIKK